MLISSKNNANWVGAGWTWAEKIDFCGLVLCRLVQSLSKVISQKYFRWQHVVAVRCLMFKGSTPVCWANQRARLHTAPPLASTTKATCTYVKMRCSFRQKIPLDGQGLICCLLGFLTYFLIRRVWHKRKPKLIRIFKLKLTKFHGGHTQWKSTIVLANGHWRGEKAARNIRRKLKKIVEQLTWRNFWINEF